MDIDSLYSTAGRSLKPVMSSSEDSFHFKEEGQPMTQQSRRVLDIPELEPVEGVAPTVADNTPGVRSFEESASSGDESQVEIDMSAEEKADGRRAKFPLWKRRQKTSRAKSLLRHGGTLRRS